MRDFSIMWIGWLYVVDYTPRDLQWLVEETASEPVAVAEPCATDAGVSFKRFSFR